MGDRSPFLLRLKNPERMPLRKVHSETLDMPKSQQFAMIGSVHEIEITDDSKTWISSRIGRSD